MVHNIKTAKLIFEKFLDKGLVLLGEIARCRVHDHDVSEEWPELKHVSLIVEQLALIFGSIDCGELAADH